MNLRKGIIYSVEFEEIPVEKLKEALREVTGEKLREKKRFYGVVGNNLIKVTRDNTLYLMGEFGVDSVKLNFVLKPIILLYILGYLFLFMMFVLDPHEELMISQFSTVLIALGVGCIFILQYFLAIRSDINFIDKIVSDKD